MGLPKNAQFIADWSLRSGLTYRDFLQAKEFEMSLRFAIDEQTQKLIGSNEQLLKRGFEQVGQDVRGGFNLMSRDIANLERALHQGTQELASSIRWGFTVLAIALKQMNQTLEEIRRILANPTWTSACEQFHKARDEYNRGLYEEAQDSINKAITLWNSEFRFHFLLGRIRIGGWIGEHPNTSPEVVDPAEAERAFLNAARYHRANKDQSDTGKAQAFLYASRAAFYHGAPDRAFEHAHKALRELAPAHPLAISAHYQCAKYLCAQGKRIKDAKYELFGAAKRDPAVLIDAAADHDFLAYREDVLDPVVADILKDFKEKLHPLNEKCEKALKGMRNFAFDGVLARELLRDELAALGREYDAVRRAAAPGSVLDLEFACKLAKELAPKFSSMFSLFKSRFIGARKDARQRSRWAHAIENEKSLCRERTSALHRAQSRYESLESRANNIGCISFSLIGNFFLLLVWFLVDYKYDPNIASDRAAPYILIGLAALLWWPVLRYLFFAPLAEVSIYLARNNCSAAETHLKRVEVSEADAWAAQQRIIDELEQMSPPF